VSNFFTDEIFTFWSSRQWLLKKSVNKTTLCFQETGLGASRVHCN